MKLETDNCPFVRFCTETRRRRPSIHHLICSPHPKPESGQDPSPTKNRLASGRRKRGRGRARRRKEFEGSQWPTDYFWHRIKNETSIAQKLRHIAQARELFLAASAAASVTVTGSATASCSLPLLLPPPPPPSSPPPSPRPLPPDKVGLALRGLMPASR